MPLISLYLAAISLFAQFPEVTTKESAVTFRSGINLIPVPVVVRDARHQPVDNLTVDDFQLTDNGKPQSISKFSIEHLKPSVSASTAKATPAASLGTDGIPTRFVAYLFDDIHMQLSDLVYTREALRRLIESTNDPHERIEIYAASGKPMQEFTSDKTKLHAALSALNIGSEDALVSSEEKSCPYMSYYLGDLIANRGDMDAYGVAATDAKNCGMPYGSYEELISRARLAVEKGDLLTRASLDSIGNTIARLASMPGERIAAVISPGFLVRDGLGDRQAALVDRAIRSGVVVNAIDSRGVFMAGVSEADDVGHDSSKIRQKLQYSRMENFALSDSLAALAEGAGGILYQGSNDMDEGFARTSAAPDVMYILSFSPLDLKTDGKLHHLNVTLKSGRGMNLQFRKSYYAPRTSANSAEREKQELEEAFFSRDEVHDLPVALETQFFSSPNRQATISAVARLDVKNLPFRRENDRNLDNVTVVTGLFDADGNFMSGVQKILELRLRDATLQSRLASGLGVKNTFAVHSGKYIVRMVARDSEGGLLTSQSALVEIP